MQRLTRSMVRAVGRSAAAPRVAAVAAIAPRARVVAAPAPVRRMAAGAAAAPAAAKPAMFCMQCEQTENQTGCTTVGVCGKTPEVASLQDLVVHVNKGIGQWTSRAYALGAAHDSEIDRFVLQSLFSTMTNVNFDAARMVEQLRDGLRLRDKAHALYRKAAAAKGVAVEELKGTPATFTFTIPANGETAPLVALGESVGVLERKARLGADYVGLIEMATYGLKGTCAYADHAMVLGQEAAEVYTGIHEVLSDLAREDLTIDQLLALNMKVGQINLKVMELLDAGGTGRFGHPVPTPVRTAPVAGKAILVSGHDLADLEEILKQSEGKGINVYTHGEMLPAHSYPGLKKYKHLVGHYGGPWQLQKMEFARFPGPIVMTTNCIIEPKKSYKERIFTRSVTGWPGVKHIANTDYSQVIASALKCEGFTADDEKSVSKPLLTGFGRDAVLQRAGAVIDAVKSGAVKHFFLVGGCDGSEGERSYFTDIAKNAPKDSIILTLGCGKYRLNKLEMGDIGGIPRVLDMGQCNDSYSAIQVAVALAKAFGTDVNGLPLSFAVSWFEQKAVAVLLTLLSLGVKRIRLGPHLPGFATPAMLDVLVKKFDVKPIGKDAAADVRLMLEKK